MRKAKKIEIVRAKQGRWYYDLIGCIFDVTGETKEVYHVVVGSISDKYSVEKYHVKVVEWDEWQPCETVKEKLLFIGKKVRRKSDGAMKGTITGMYDNGFRLGSDGIVYADNKDLLEGYELLDGSPIGVKKSKELLE